MIKRIKRAIAGFLREELREYTDYSQLQLGPLHQQVILDEIKFDTYKMESIIDIDTPYYPADSYDGPVSYQIDVAKRKMAAELMDHIHVDTRELTDPVHIGKAAIRLTLRIQVPK